MTDHELENLVVTLTARGWSGRRVARELGISRNTVRGVLERVSRAREQGQSALPGRVRRKSMLDAHEPRMRELLESYPDITAVRMHEELVKAGFDGSYTIVRERVRALRPRPKVEPARRLETDPGKQGQQDWSPYTLPFVETGSLAVQCFSLVLAFSRRHYIQFTEDAGLHSMLRQHVAAFKRFRGVPKEILYDRQKVVVLGREAGRDIYNPKFLAFATHYGFKPRALPARKPKWKGKVERPFQDVEGNLLNARTFNDLRHLNEVADWWMDHRSDLHPHRMTRQSPLERFAQEEEHLLHLPVHDYDTAEVGYRVVDRTGFVSWQGTPYSVPWAHVLDLVVVRATAEEVIVYGDDLQPVARHGRAPRGQLEPVFEPSHHPAKPKKKRDIEALIARVTALGEAGAAFAVGVCRSKRYRGAELEAVLRHQERYALDDLVRAMERAVRYRAFDARVVTRILETTATPRCLPDSGVEEARQRLHSLGHEAVGPRDLSVYGAALGENPKPG